MYNSGGTKGWLEATAPFSARASSICGGILVPPSPGKRRLDTCVPGAAGTEAHSDLAGWTQVPHSSRIQSAGSLWMWASIALAEGAMMPGGSVKSWPHIYESSPRISFTKAAMSVFLVLCKVKKGCSCREEEERIVPVGVKRRKVQLSPSSPQVQSEFSQATLLLLGKLLLILLGSCPRK